MIRKVLLCGALVCALGLAAPMDVTVPKRPSKKLWWVSVAVLGVASAFDVQSSWGKAEVNPLLRGPDGRFGARGLAVKSALVGGSCALQWLLLRHRRGMVTPVAILNAAAAGAVAAAAVHNGR